MVWTFFCIFETMELIKQHIDELKTLCKQCFVSKLHVFGSFAVGKFSESSDIDFLVQFSNVDPFDYFDNYMDFKESLELLFNREIDLLEVQTIKNPILKNAVERDKIILYGREDTKMAV